MLWIRPGSHVLKLLTLLSVCGEFPTASLHILGSERIIKKLVYRLQSKEVVRDVAGVNHGEMRLLTVTGKHPNRTIRLFRPSLPLLDLVHPRALEYYLDSFWDHRFPGDDHIERNHRVAEVIACCMMAGIEFRPYVLTPLQNTVIMQEVPGWARFYVARDYKNLTGDEFNKTMYSRMVGMILYPGGIYAVYNTRGAVMKWKGAGEGKASLSLQELARWNNGAKPAAHGTGSALLFGRSPHIALETLREASKEPDRSRHFARIYNRIHYLPLNADGIRLLRILTLPDWDEMVLDCLFPPEMRIQGFSNFDAQRGGVFYFSHLDSDLARLNRIKQEVTRESIEVLCFPWQSSFLVSYLGSHTKITVVELDWLEEQLGIG